MISVTAALTFTGSVAHATATVTGADPAYPVNVFYVWDDGSADTSHTGLTPDGSGNVIDTADHTYAAHDYNTTLGPGSTGGGAILVEQTDSTGAHSVNARLPLPVPEPTIDLSSVTGHAPLTATLTAGQLTSYVAGVSDVRWDWVDTSGWSATTFTPLTTHVWVTPGWYTTSVNVTNSVGWVHRAFIPRPIVTGYRPLRQHPRDDYLGGAPRQGTTNPSRSVQVSARQGWINTYR